MEAAGQPTAKSNAAPVTDAPAAETAPGDTSLFGNDGLVSKHTAWGSSWATRDEFKAAYFAKNHPRHEEAVQEMLRVHKAQQMKTDEVELEAIGGKDSIPEGEQMTMVDLPPARAGQEWDKVAASQAIAIAEQAGIPTSLVQEAVNVIAKTGAPPMSYEEGEKRLRVIFGADFDSKLAAANRVLAEFPLMRDFIIDSGYGNDPGLIHWLAQQGQSRQTVQQQIDELSVSDAYLKGGHPKHDETVERVRLLYKKLYA